LTSQQGHGDQKFTPGASRDALQRLATASIRATELCRIVIEPMLSRNPSSLGFPSESTQSAYYPGPSSISKDEIAQVSECLERHHIFPENIRIRKYVSEGKTTYSVLQASVGSSPKTEELLLDGSNASIRVVRGDHSAELSEICDSLSEAKKYTANSHQELFISQYIESFRIGDLERYRDSQRTWIADRAPKVENIFGFVEPYRDPFGIRAEFEALVAISNAEETKALTRLVVESDTFISRLPWAKGCTENNGKGPFEKALFEPPDFASIHSMTTDMGILVHSY
jgi:dipeptidyl-peptidase III